MSEESTNQQKLKEDAIPASAAQNGAAVSESTDESTGSETETVVLDAEAEAVILARLRALGYIE